ncbi:MAG: hypothetical protein WBA22_02490 [Candidatus Methanofastidiosia archaeon]
MNEMPRNVKRIMIVVALIGLAMVNKPQTAGSPSAVVLQPGDGLEFFRFDIVFPMVERINSPYGLATVDSEALEDSTGISSGYLNVQTNDGWVIRNMPIEKSSAYAGMSVMFNLVCPEYDHSCDMTRLMAYAVFSTKPFAEFSGNPATEFGVDSIVYNAQGRNVGRAYRKFCPIDVGVIDFNPGGLMTMIYQPGHPNIEQDIGQCGPASVANCLQWLEKCGLLTVDDDHRSGIRDKTLVGELDTCMNRFPRRGVTDYNFLWGKLKYLYTENLSASLYTKHKNRLGGEFLLDDVFYPEDNPLGSAVSRVDRNQNISLIDWIIEELANGEDVEVAIGWDTDGGHWINLIGGGYILGVPWIAWVHDAAQGQDGGTDLREGGYGFSPIVNNRIVCFIGGEYTPGTIDLAVSQSPRYDPPIWGNIVAYPVSENMSHSDLNGDLDCDDTILCYRNIDDQEIFNTTISVLRAHDSIDIFESTVAFVGENSEICYFNLDSGTLEKTHFIGNSPSIYNNILAYVSNGEICYFNTDTQEEVNTANVGSSPSVYMNAIVFHTIPESTISVYNVGSGVTENTGVVGRNAAIHGELVAFETLESTNGEDLNNDGDTNDWVIRYFNLKTRDIVNTGAVGRYPALNEDYIVFTTSEADLREDLNGDGKILGDVIRYYDIDKHTVVNTRHLGTEPDIYKNTVSCYIWENWTDQDSNDDGNLDDPYLEVFEITASERSVTCPEIGFSIILLIILGAGISYKKLA